MGICRNRARGKEREGERERERQIYGRTDRERGKASHFDSLAGTMLITSKSWSMTQSIVHHTTCTCTTSDTSPASHSTYNSKNIATPSCKTRCTTCTHALATIQGSPSLQATKTISRNGGRLEEISHHCSDNHCLSFNTQHPSIRCEHTLLKKGLSCKY